MASRIIKLGVEGLAELRSLGRLVTRSHRDGSKIEQMERGLSATVTKAEDDTYEVIASDATEDRYGDIVEPGGWKLDNYLKNPVWLADHTYWVEYLVGRALDTRVEKGRLISRYKPDPINSSPVTDIVLAKLDSGSLRAVSVGFMPLVWEKIRDEHDDWTGSFRFIEQELLENSWVVVPANPNALLLSAPEPHAALALPPSVTTERADVTPDNAKALDELTNSIAGLWARSQRGALAAMR
jgi:HK97 family phage prohead protease